MIHRRTFLGASAAATAGLAWSTQQAVAALQAIDQPDIPRWRGFNLTEMFTTERNEPFKEADFKWIAELGFDFVRLPMSYWCWSDPDDWTQIDERVLEQVDQAIDYGAQYGIHVNLNFHRIPGYCVNGREREPYQLFDSPPEEMRKALDAARYHWQTFAERYKGLPNERVSFDLMNEPPWMDGDTRYDTIVRALVEAIRAVDPDRLIVADGTDIGQTPVPDIVDLGLVQSTRGYLPKAVSHYTASWVPKNEFETFKKPTWPLVDDSGTVWNKAKLREELIAKWQPLAEQGIPIHVGEWGCYNKTPHDVTLAWMSDLLALWKEAGWGWAMWNFRGAFGILDSGREDVDYDNFHGHQLDRKMLELLQAG